MSLEVKLVRSEMFRGNWYGTVVDPDLPKEKVIWVSNICRNKKNARAQATNKLRELSKQ